MDVSLLVWLLTCAAVVAVFVFDFYAHVRTPHAPSMRESALWTVVYVSAAVVFGIVVWFVWGPSFGGEFFAGYVTEKALSVDNLFVFVVIFSRFAVPREHQQKALLLGIAIALVLRGGFIALGAAAIDAFSWVFYVFGAILLYTAAKLLRDAIVGGSDTAGGGSGGGSENSAQQGGNGRIAGAVRRMLPTTAEYYGDRLVARVDGRRLATPLLAALMVIGVTDVLFALDSIPAIYGLTQQPYIVFTANALALMGLRQLFFLLEGLLDRLTYLSHGLALILAFIAVKLVLHALHDNALPFVNGGDPVAVPEISTVVSLAVIVVILAGATAASLLHSRRRREPA